MTAGATALSSRGVPLLFLLFVATPIFELWLLFEVGSFIGAGWTIALVVGTGALGAWLARREGFKTLQEFMRQSERGLLPGQQIFDGLAIFAGGALLMTPGIATDLFGFLLLLPPSRAVARRLAMTWLRQRIATAQTVVMTGSQANPPQGWRPPDDRVYDQTFDEEDPPGGSQGRGE